MIRRLVKAIMNFARRPGFRETRSQTQLIPRPGQRACIRLDQDLWGYQDDTPEIVHLGNGANEEQLEKLADQFILGDPEIINSPFFLKDAFGILSRMEV